MPKLDPARLGQTIGPFHHTHRWQDVSLYALACGARADELDLVLEARGPAVLPSFLVVVQSDAFHQAMVDTGGDLLMRLHAAQRFELHAPVPPEGTLSTSVTTRAYFDQGRGALAIFDGETVDDKGALVARATMEIFYRGHGGFGGEKREDPPSAAPERAPDLSFVDETTPTQAQLYRLASGDANAVHLDPAVARKVGMPKPILHGMCTFSFATRAAIATLGSGAPSSLRAIGARFTRPVFPGETLTTELWHLGGGQAALRTRSSSRGEVVLEGTCQLDAP
jgi:acyl dehydratase